MKIKTIPYILGLLLAPWLGSARLQAQDITDPTEPEPCVRYYNRTITFCEGESATFEGRTYTESGKDTLRATAYDGCDSVVCLAIIAHPRYYFREEVSISNTETYPWHDMLLYHSGTYFDRNTSQYGCDSIYELTLTVRPKYIFEKEDAICETKAPYKWRDKEFGEIGTHTYEDFYKTKQGEDSIYRLTLTIYPAYQMDTLISICPGETIEFLGKKYKTPGDYKETLRSSFGCDSVWNIHINYKESFLQVDSVGIRDNEVYTWPVTNKQYVNPGRYEVRDINRFNCDSIHRLELFRYPKYFFEEDSVNCVLYTTPYVLWHNQPLTQTGTYWDSLYTINGQDSIYKLNLTILDRTDTTIYMNICKADYYQFGNVMVTKSGVYHDTISNVAGCDSIITLSITFTNFEEELTDTICDGDTIFWRGDTITAEGFYSQRVPDELGCDSIFSLSVTMLYPFTHDSQDTICEKHLLEKEPYLWGPNKRELWGKWNDEKGCYEDSIYWNCNHTHYLHLKVLPERHSKEEIPLCAGDFTVRNLHTGHPIRLDSAGYYYDTIPSRFDHDNSFACDSIVCWHVTINPTYKDTVRKEYNTKNLPLDWNGIPITGPGYYTAELQTKKGCDSTVVLVASTITYVTETICEGDSLDFHGTSYKEKGNYTYTFAHSSGLDSVIQLTLNIRPALVIAQTADISDKEDYTWRLRDADGTIHDCEFKRPITSGVYTDTLKSSQDCDSIVILTLTVHPTYLIPEEIAVCQNELPYRWRNQQLFQAGDYTDTLQTEVWHYDSIYTLHFSVLPTYETKLSPRLCYGEAYQFNQKIYTKPGIYRDTIGTDHYGCDSVFVIDLKWYEIYDQTLYAKCHTRDLPYLWKVGDKTRPLYHTGDYSETLQSVHGCDSTIRMKFTVYTTYEFPDTINVCQNELPYLWRGQQLMTADDYTDSIKTKNDNDTVYKLHFVIRPTSERVVTVKSCYNTPVQYLNKIYTKPGIYRDTLPTLTYGCDSIFIINVVWNDIYHTVEAATIRSGQTYTWEQNGQTYSKTGTYTDTIQASTGCDSIIELHLLVYDKEILINEGTVDVCSPDLPYRWRGQDLYKTDVYYDTVFHPATDTIHMIALNVLELKNELHEHVLCDGDYFEWKGKIITHDTLYYDIEETGLGCGIKHTIFIRFRKAQTLIDNKITDDQHPYTWPVTGKTYAKSGTYRHTILTEDEQCDSIHYVLNLTVGATYLIKDTISPCENDLPLTWHGQAITGVGEYTDTLETVLHFDSAFLLVVKEILPIYRETQYINLCEGSTIVYRGKTYDKAGTFYDTIPALNGCDSIMQINVRVFPTMRSYESVDISDKQTPYLWNGQELTKSGTTFAYLKTKDDCDSIAQLELRIHPTHFIPEEIETCDNEPVFWHGKTYTESGTYYDSLSTYKWGYDSIHALTLTIHPSYLFNEHIQIQRGATTTIHGLNIDHEGIYMDTLTSVYGCDSIYRITANYPRSYALEYNDTICNGDTYIFYGRPYTISQTLTEELGPDSIEICHLTVLPSYYEDKRVVLFPGEFPYIYNGVPYYEPGTYTFQYLTARHNCDSTLVLHLIRSEHYSEWDYMPLCTGSMILIDTDTITKSGSYTFLRRSKISGDMDSLYRLEVYDAPAYDLPAEKREICNGDTVLWNGRQYWRTGEYEYRQKTTEGCDSIAHLSLTVHPTYNFYTDATIPDYESYSWRGSQYSQSGEYEMTYPTMEGCDSTYTLRLKVIETLRNHTEDSICAGESYIWRGKTYTDPGNYSDTVNIPGSLTFAIYTLHLSVVNPTIIRSAHVGSVCADAESFELQVDFGGIEPQSYTVLFDQHALREGFKDIHDAPYHGTIELPMPSSGHTLYKGHADYVRPDTYSLRLVIDNGICGVSKSDSLHIEVRYPSWIIEQVWEDVVAPLKAELNGGYEFEQYQWYVNGKLFPTDRLAYLHTSFKNEDEVVLYATRRGENYAIPTCPIYIEIATTASTGVPVLVTPSAAPRQMPTMRIQAGDNGEYSLYSPTGQLIRTSAIEIGEQDLTLPAVTGCYLLRTRTNSGETQTHKLIIY